MSDTPTLFSQTFSFLKDHVKGLISGSVVVFLAFVGVTGYYYYTTSPATILVTAEDFPAGFARFTQNELMNDVSARLAELVKLSGGSDSPKGGFGIRPAKEWIFKPASDASSPAYKLEYKGVSLNVCRKLGMSLRAKRFLSVAVNDVSDTGWRLSAMMEESPQYTRVSIGNVPASPQLCSDIKGCAGDLAEKILQSLDFGALVNYYILQKNDSANKKILAAYADTPPGKLTSTDLVIWGDTFQRTGDVARAFEKYNAALELDKNSCAASAARGYLYDQTAQKNMDTLRTAEDDLRRAVKCDPKNKFTLTSLCHVLTQQWKQAHSQTQLLEDARQSCQQALDVDPSFTIASTNIGYILYRQDKYADSLSWFEKLSKTESTNSSVFANHGFLLYLEYLRTKNIDLLHQAIDKTDRAFALDGMSFVATNNLGYFNYENGNYNAAVEWWNKAKLLDPNDPDLLAGLALGNFKLGRNEEASALLSQAIEHDSRYQQPNSLLGDPHHWSEQMVSDLRTFSARRR